MEHIYTVREFPSPPDFHELGNTPSDLYRNENGSYSKSQGPVTVVSLHPPQYFLLCLLRPPV